MSPQGCHVDWNIAHRVEIAFRRKDRIVMMLQLVDFGKPSSIRYKVEDLKSSEAVLYAAL